MTSRDSDTKTRRHEEEDEASSDSVVAQAFRPAIAATKAIKAGRLVDPAGNVITNAVIVVDNDRITSVGTGAAPAGADVIDLTRYTLVPGLIDAHTHMTYYWDRTPYA